MLCPTCSANLRAATREALLDAVEGWSQRLSDGAHSIDQGKRAAARRQLRALRLELEGLRQELQG